MSCEIYLHNDQFCDNWESYDDNNYQCIYSDIDDVDEDIKQLRQEEKLEKQKEITRILNYNFEKEKFNALRESCKSFNISACDGHNMFLSLQNEIDSFCSYYSRIKNTKKNYLSNDEEYYFYIDLINEGYDHFTAIKKIKP